ncbi:hypothetical protein SAMN04489711_101387 [Paracidovorax wautersii]|uniref:Uncharacterized protein n=2 Tax=Paracidovorax wautersii TaxID=1177982 RepID=A0A1I1ZWV6_9BURK|nr:hypothetical protein SAMN04489711_101387 [Paracidovorax wautersii]
MRHLSDTMVPADAASRRGTAADGMGDVRVFWIAAAIAVVAVVAVVAFKLEGRELRSALFSSFPVLAQQTVASSAPGTGRHEIALRTDSKPMGGVAR